MKRPEESVIASNYAALLLRQTRSCGLDDAEVLASTQLEAAALEGGMRTINGRQFLQMLKNVSGLIDDSAFPVRYGMSMSIATHGIMGYALLASATGRDAFDLALRYYKTVFSIMNIQAEEEDGQVHFVFDFEIDTDDLKPFLIDGVFAGMLSVSRFVLGLPALPCTVQFRDERPPHAELYDRIFGIRPQYNCQRDEIIVDRNLLEVPLPTHDPQTRKMAEAQCQQVLESMEQFCSLPEKIKKIIKSNPAALPTLTDVSDKLHMHPRTLGRRLSEFDTCFKTLLEEVKSELAMQYLADSRLPIDDIAFSLNYNDATSFYRAFKRWTGSSPSSYRTKARAWR